MILWQFVILTFGLALLWAGAEVMVNNSIKLARAQGISPLVIGLTVVSIGTSIPELGVSSLAAFQDNIGISIGNIIGSNIANLGLILGVGALILPLKIKTSWVRREVPYMIFVTIVFLVIAYSGYVILWYEGFVLLALLSLFLLYVGRFTLKEMSEFKEMAEENGVERVPRSTKIKYLAMAFVGIAILLAGSQLSVMSGTKLAGILGVSDSIIGLTLIALGTSLPELATTIVGATRKSVDLVVGNVIGSNIFNLALIGGLTALIRPIPIDLEAKLMDIEFPLLIFISLLVWPMMRFRWNIERYEGFILLSIYVVFIYFTIGV